jgi:transposase
LDDWIASLRKVVEDMKATMGVVVLRSLVVKHQVEESFPEIIPPRKNNSKSINHSITNIYYAGHTIRDLMSREKKNSRRHKLLRNALIMNLVFEEKLSVETVAHEVGLGLQNTKGVIKRMSEEGITYDSIKALERYLDHQGFIKVIILNIAMRKNVVVTAATIKAELLKKHDHSMSKSSIVKILKEDGYNWRY